MMHGVPSFMVRVGVPAVALALVVALAPTSVQAQDDAGRWVVEPETSVAWWQIDPNYGHLWATTCPEDPAWQAGEGWTLGGLVDFATRKETKYIGVHDERIPLYPREDVHPVCYQAVHGEVTVSDPDAWSGVTGEIRIRPDSLLMGSRIRDKFMRRKVFETGKYREMRFAIQELKGVQVGDTIRGTAVGTFELRGVEREIEVPVTAWEEAGGVRVQGKWQTDVRDLTDVYGVSKIALGMGVVAGRWDTLHMGLDLILKPAGGSTR